MNSRSEIDARLDFAVEIARAAGQQTLAHFRRQDLVVERKADNSPVTIADRAAEQLLRARIAERFPHDSVLGEEFGLTEGTSAYRWVLDPIDGTKAFIHGVPLYTTLVAVLADGEPAIGVIYAPACGELVYAATGGPCWHVDENSADAKPQSAHVSRVAQLRDGLVLTSDIGIVANNRDGDSLPVFLKLQRAARLARTWGDGFGYLLVATGRAEVMIDPEMNIWDVAALIPVIEAAGGHFRDWRGERSLHSSNSLATNGLVTEEVLAIVRG